MQQKAFLLKCHYVCKGTLSATTITYPTAASQIVLAAQQASSSGPA